MQVSVFKGGTVNGSIIDTAPQVETEKREYLNYQMRKRSLPQEYQIVIKEMEQYFWNFALNSSIMDLLYCLIELFEEGAREQRSVLSITGNDVGGFCDDLITRVQLDT